MSTYVLISGHPLSHLTAVHAGYDESYHGVSFSTYCSEPGAAPEHLQVLFASLDVIISNDTEIIDIDVKRREEESPVSFVFRCSDIDIRTFFAL